MEVWCYYAIYCIVSPPLMLSMYSGGVELQTGRALHRLDAVLESVMVFRVASRAVAEVVVPFGFAEAGFFSRRPVYPVVLGVVACRMLM